jgi:hypothetical protein
MADQHHGFDLRAYCLGEWRSIAVFFYCLIHLLPLRLGYVLFDLITGTGANSLTIIDMANGLHHAVGDATLLESLHIGIRKFIADSLSAYEGDDEE